jgi:colicin import membrane protein
MNAVVEYIPAAEQVGTKIAAYSQTEAALADLRERYADKQFDVTTTVGLAAAKKARADLRAYRIALEAKREEIKAPILDQGRLIDSEAKRITLALTELETPIDEQIKVEEKRKEDDRLAKVEAARVAAETLRVRLDGIRTAAVVCIGMSACDIAGELRKLETLDLSDLPEDQVRIFEAARTVTIAQLGDMYTDKLGAEQEAQRLDDERAELERQRAADAAERERLNKIAEDEHAELQALSKIIMGCIGKSSAWVADTLAFLHSDPPVNPTNVVSFAYADAIKQLEGMIESAKSTEAAAAQAAQEAQERADAEAADRAKRDQEEADARAERVRVDGIKRRIDDITMMQRQAVGRSSEAIAVLLIELEEVPADFAEFSGEAVMAQNATMIELRRLHAEAVERERQDAEFRAQVKADSDRKAQEAADKRAADEKAEKEAAEIARAETQRRIAECTLFDAATIALAELSALTPDSLGVQMLRSAIERAA